MPVVSVEQALDTLTAAGQAQRDEDGRVMAILGLSLLPTAHALVLDGVSLHTWCALDVVGIPAALEANARVTSACASCGSAIEIEVQHGVSQAEPGIVASVPTTSCSNVREEFCVASNFFCSDDHYRAAHGTSSSAVAMSIDELEELGRALWDDFNSAERR